MQKQRMNFKDMCTTITLFPTIHKSGYRMKGICTEDISGEEVNILSDSYNILVFKA
jgi:hypothetical protein